MRAWGRKVNRHIPALCENAKPPAKWVQSRVQPPVCRGKFKVAITLIAIKLVAAYAYCTGAKCLLRTEVRRNPVGSVYFT